MLRMGSVMKLRPGMAAEYEKRHAALWPELIDAIKKGGASNYTIFHDPETDLLFEYIEIEDAAVWAARSGDAVTRRWWDYMADIMETNPDRSPLSRPLTPLFHLD